MQHGAYIAEFEKVLLQRSFAISHHSLSELINQVDFSKLRDTTEADRFAFYQALVESIKDQGRGIEDGVQILGEDDARQIVLAMSDKASKHQLASSRIRDIWCRIFIGGCP